MLKKIHRRIIATIIVAIILAACEILISIYMYDFEPKRKSILNQSIESILASHQPSPTKVQNEALPLNKMCETYFNTLHDVNANWSIDNFQNSNYPLLSNQQVINSVRNLRIYGKCFIDQNSILADDKLASKLFPFCTFQLPEYMRWDGTMASGIPYLNKNHTPENRQQSASPKNPNHFWKYFKERMNGQGIVISLGEIGVLETMQLIKILRYLGNELPIQLVHKGDVSNESIQKIISAARDKVSVNDKTYITGFPQEVWFVNASSAIRDDSMTLFQRFSNKWIACLFNSFDDIILMDSDTIPFIKPSYFFHNVGFKENGALFFKDRENEETLKPSDVSFFKKLLPTTLESNTFGISMMSSLTSDNKFFKHNSKHVMESGLVVMKRSTHLLGLLVSTNMQFWQRTSDPIYGDKELFWLGQSISGNERYQFNKDSAAAIGMIKEEQEGKTKSICSTQPAHFDKDKKLLWLNGGLKNCKKKASWKKDFNNHKHLRKTFKSMENLRTNYNQPIEINGAIIPPKVQRNSWNRIKNPKYGFQNTPSLGCNGYVWCAFVNEDVPNEDISEVIHFNEDEIEHIRIITTIWNS